MPKSDDSKVHKLLLVGNPNVGKTTLFNALTSSRARVGNYPGITVEYKTARAKIDSHAFEVVDLPGLYSLSAHSQDEAIALEHVLGALSCDDESQRVVAVVDATRLERNLYLVAQLQELCTPDMLILTMVEEVDRRGLSLDVAALSAELQIPVALFIPTDAQNLRNLKGEIVEMLFGGRTPRLPQQNKEKLARGTTERLESDGKEFALNHGWSRPREPLFYENLGLLAGSLSTNGQAVVSDANWSAVSRRYQRASAWLKRAIQPAFGESPGVFDATSHRIDKVLLHPFWGSICLLAVFGVFFQALFSWSQPAVEFIDTIREWLVTIAELVLPQGTLFSSLVVDGIIAGVGSVVSFVPLIGVLFMFLSLLEESGYLARATFLLDRVMAKAGLPGKAFVPLLSGFACAVPAIMATRSIESRKDRLLTIFVTPFTSCSARLPVYGLMIASIFSSLDPLFGVFDIGAMVMMSMYLLGLGVAFLTAYFLKRQYFKSPLSPLLLELPPYRLPRLSTVMASTWRQVRHFLKEAGTVILALTIVLWALFTFPRDQVPVTDTTVTQASGATVYQSSKHQLERSYAGQLGRFIEPAIEPLGFDWKIGIGIVASFAAREVLVSTLGMVYGLGPEANEADRSLKHAIISDINPKTNKPVYGPLSALALMVFFALSMQCMSTLAVTRKETESLLWPIAQFVYMTGVAWVCTFLVYQVGLILGFG